jgi:hypothetical protein
MHHHHKVCAACHSSMGALHDAYLLIGVLEGDHALCISTNGLERRSVQYSATAACHDYSWQQVDFYQIAFCQVFYNCNLACWL